MKRIELRSTWARAVVPVLGGLAFIAVLGVVLWGFAALIAGNSEQVTNLAPDRFEVGRAESMAAIVAEDGPLLFPGLGPDSGDKTIVLGHDGGDPLTGWFVRSAHPADRSPSCTVEQVQGTTRFVDCDGREIDVKDLAAPVGINPVVENRSDLIIDLSAANAAASTTVP